MRISLLTASAVACLALTAQAQTRIQPVQPPKQNSNLQPAQKPNTPIQNRVQPIPIQTPPNTNLQQLQQQQQQFLQQQQQYLLQQQLLQQQLLQQQANRNSGVNFYEKGSLSRGQRRTHRVQLQADVTYSISLASKNFDPYLELQRNNRTIRRNDDGGAGLNSRIVFRPTQSGTYQVVVSALDDQPGNYTLTVRRE